MLRVKIVLLVLAAAVVGVLVLRHTPGLNGPPFFPWSWRYIPSSIVLPAMIAASLPLFAALLLDWRNRSLRPLTIGLLMVACLLMKLASIFIMTNPPSLALVPATVKHPEITSYYTDAQALSQFPPSYWLAQYSTVMPRLNLHSQTKPLGPVLYWMMCIRSMGAERAAMFGGLLLGLLATLSIPATYLLLKRLLDNTSAAFHGAAFLAACPGFVLMFPMFDPTFILLSTALVGFWFAALAEDRTLWSVLLGVVLAATWMITFNVLVIGVFMVALVPFTGDRALHQRIGVAMWHALLAASTAVVLLLVVWLVTGHDPLLTFFTAIRNQHQLLAAHPNDRLYPQTIWFDLTDFALASGWISVLLVIFSLIGPRGDVAHPSHRTLVLLALLQFVAVAATGLLQSETARVWNFMLPLMMIPAGIELARWPMWGRMIAFGAIVGITAIIHQNMAFIY
jgi:hypothetical protein